MNVVDGLRRLARDLDSFGARWALIGGLAVSIHTEPRTTRDVDVAVAVSSDREAEALVRSLFSLGYRLVAHLEQTERDRISMMRLLFPEGVAEDVIGDLLFASSGIEVELVEAAQTLEVQPGVEVKVSTVGDLIALKLLAFRLQDQVDLNRLIEVAEDDDLARARWAVELIERRQYDRIDEDEPGTLSERLEDLIAQRPKP